MNLELCLELDLKRFEEFVMKHAFLVLVGAVLIVGCNNTTTSTAPKVTTRGDTVTKKLSLTAAKDQTIARGATDKVTITVTRDNFDEPVTVSLSGLPTGVEVVEKESTIRSGSNTMTLTLKAAADAAVGEHAVTISADAVGMPKNTQTFKLTVK